MVDHAMSGGFVIDEAVVEVLPQGTKVLSISSYGSSDWSVTARMDAESEDGTPMPLFIKCICEDQGEAQVYGEFLAMSELYKTVPALVPRPYGWGKFKSGPSAYFFACEFINISDKMPDPVQLGALIADLHKRSESPTGRFGFPVPTYDGSQVQVTSWDASWPRFFTNLLRGIQELDWRTNGHWKELDDALDRTYTRVIPRLLGALEADGRTIKPCFIHGDLWESNIGTEIETGNIFIYDASAYYAHNEMELGIWRVDHHRMKEKAYREEYRRNYKPSEPADEWDDRNRLYSTKTTLINSASFDGTSVRLKTLEDLNYLIDKYAPWAEKRAERHDGWG